MSRFIEIANEFLVSVENKELGSIYVLNIDHINLIKIDSGGWIIIYFDAIEEKVSLYSAKYKEQIIEPFTAALKSKKTYINFTEGNLMNFYDGVDVY